MSSMVIRPDGEMYGVYTADHEGPHAQFREYNHALDWGHLQYKNDFYLLVNYTALLGNSQEQKDAIKAYEDSKKQKSHERHTKTS